MPSPIPVESAAPAGSPFPVSLTVDKFDLLERVGRPETLGFQADMAHTLLYLLGHNAPGHALLPADWKWSDPGVFDAALARLADEVAASREAVTATESARPALAAKAEDRERASRAAELALAKATADQAGVEAEWRVAEAAVDQAQSRLCIAQNCSEWLAQFVRK